MKSTIESQFKQIRDEGHCTMDIYDLSSMDMECHAMSKEEFDGVHSAYDLDAVMWRREER